MQKPYSYIWDTLSPVRRAQKLAFMLFVSYLKPQRGLILSLQDLLPPPPPIPCLILPPVAIIFIILSAITVEAESSWRLKHGKKMQRYTAVLQGLHNLNLVCILLWPLEAIERGPKEVPYEPGTFSVFFRFLPQIIWKKYSVLLYAPKVKLQPADRTISAAATRVNSERQDFFAK